jgi:hypothetical protein
MNCRACSGTTESLLYRRDTFRGTFCDLICTALVAERDAEIAFSPGFRWGTKPFCPGIADHRRRRLQQHGDQATRRSTRTTMTGQRIRSLLGRCPPTGSATPILISATTTTWSAAAGCAYRLEAEEAAGRPDLQHRAQPDRKGARFPARPMWLRLGQRRRPGARPSGLGSDRETHLRPHQNRPHQAADQRPGRNPADPGGFASPPPFPKSPGGKGAANAWAKLQLSLAMGPYDRNPRLARWHGADRRRRDRSA